MNLTNVLIVIYVKRTADQNHEEDFNDDDDDNDLRCTLTSDSTQLLQKAEILIVIMN